VVLLGKGDHEVTSSWTTRGGVPQQTMLGITCSNITFIGQGIGETTILGGFGIHNVQNILLKQVTVTNTNGTGMSLYGANVELVDVAFVHCAANGIYARCAASAPSQLVATRCEMSNNGGNGLCIFNSNRNIPLNVCLKNCIIHHNEYHGISTSANSLINIHGDATAIHSNVRYGIWAYDSGEVLIHLPSHHNTSYNNIREDRFTNNGGSITNVEEEAEDN